MLAYTKFCNKKNNAEKIFASVPSEIGPILVTRFLAKKCKNICKKLFSVRN